ncbi:hypothetical protein [Nonomuraea cypriaca]|uniref:hypothetical protein n=1 Tax=Nonomuraea cypriaca TaxID=1187855 RepID=UPI002E2D6A03|nr:hypothetical protein [Nonomuraea cypriaca]
MRLPCLHWASARRAPNPPVGCVILDSGGRVVGEGFHRRKGEAHTEVNALVAAGPLPAAARPW